VALLKIYGYLHHQPFKRVSRSIHSLKSLPVVIPCHSKRSRLQHLFSSRRCRRKLIFFYKCASVKNKKSRFLVLFFLIFFFSNKRKFHPSARKIPPIFFSHLPCLYRHIRFLFSRLFLVVQINN
jgi:hypothetical protein